MEKSTSLSFIVDRIIAVGLFFLLAGVPLLINPFALDYWYKPKIHSVYALLIILVTVAAGKIILSESRASQKQSTAYPSSRIRDIRHSLNNLYYFTTAQYPW